MNYHNRRAFFTAGSVRQSKLILIAQYLNFTGVSVFHLLNKNQPIYIAITITGTIFRNTYLELLTVRKEKTLRNRRNLYNETFKMID